MCVEARITGVEINPGCRPNPADPHTWLVLVGDEVGSHKTRVMYGCLRPVFRGHHNTATAFALAKIMAGAPSDTPPWTQTAARAEVLLPAGADDRLSDPRVLMETLDAELPVKAKAVLCFLTFTFPTDRLHQQYECVRAFTRQWIVDLYGVAALLIQHAPNRAGSANLPHVHVLVAGPRRLSGLGFGEWVMPLATDKAHTLISTAFRVFRDDWQRA